MRKIVSFVLSLAMVLGISVSSLVSAAMAAENLYQPSLGSSLGDAAGVSAKVRFAAPFGAPTKEEATPYLGLSLNATKSFNNGALSIDRTSVTRTLADIRLTSDGISKANLGGVNLLNAGNSSGNVGNIGNTTFLWVLVAIALGVGGYLILDDGSSESSSSSPNT